MAGVKVSNNSKISPEFSARLKQVGPQQKVRAVVFLNNNENPQSAGRRQSRVQREAMINQKRQSAEPALKVIDGILDRYDGKRLTENVNALGSISVETTVAGITALADTKHVKTILEDQSISIVK